MNEIFFDGNFHKIAEIKEFSHEKMIGIFDEPPSNYINYLNIEDVKEVYPCNACQGSGCIVCNGYGKIII